MKEDEEERLFRALMQKYDDKYHLKEENYRTIAYEYLKEVLTDPFDRIDDLGIEFHIDACYGIVNTYQYIHHIL